MPGLGQEPARPLAIEAGRGHLRVVAGQRGRKDPLPRDHAALEEPVHDARRIDGVGDGQTHATVVEGRLLHVEADRVGAEGRPDRDLALQRGIGLDRAAVAGGDVAHVEVAGREIVEAGDLGRDDPEHDALEPGRAAEVVGKRVQDHSIVAAPLLQTKGPAAHRPGGESEAESLGLLAGHDGRRVVGHQEEERGERRVELELHGALVHYPDSRDLAALPLDEGRGARDLLEHPGALPARGALEGELHVGGPHRTAVLELHAGTKRERVHALVRGHRPALGQRGPRLEALVELHQRVEDLPDHRGRRGVGGLSGIERRRVGGED
jgi:hypothetical protein